MNDLLMRFKREYCNPTRNPVEFGIKLTKERKENKVNLTL